MKSPYQANAADEVYPVIPATHMNRTVRRALSGMNRHLLPKIWNEFFFRNFHQTKVAPREENNV